MKSFYERPKNLEGLPDDVKANILQAEQPGEDDDWSEYGSPVHIVETQEDIDKVFEVDQDDPSKFVLYENCWLEGRNWFYAFFSTSSYTGFHYYIPKALVETNPKLLKAVEADNPKPFVS
jgi:hypothetical protein